MARPHTFNLYELELARLLDTPFQSPPVFGIYDRVPTSSSGLYTAGGRLVVPSFDCCFLVTPEGIGH
jgi:hypothetical protein